MGTFNFKTVNKPVTTQSYLQAWNIYDNASFGGISEPVTGTTKDGDPWKAWDITFSTPKGVYKERIFSPTEQSGERREFDGANGGKIVLPSEVERIQEIFRQIVSVYATDKGKEQLNKLVETGKFDNISFDDFIKVMTTVLKDPKKPTEENPIQIKLQGRTSDGRTYAKLPSARISNQAGSEGEVWMERFIGANLTMSPYEMQQASKVTSAKPTNMDTVDKPAEDVDIDSIMNSL